MEKLIINNLTFNYKSKEIFKNYSLEIPGGAMVALTGPSGSGKSTLAQLLAGHLLPAQGEILLGHKKITHPLKEIFIVHQEDDLFPWMNVYEQLNFVEKSRDKILDLLKIFKLDHCQNLYPHQLSGGMKKRLALARAELLRPQVLILDETFSSLDHILAKEILNEMVQRWKNKGMTIIFITHHLNDFRSFIDHEIRLSH